MSQNLISKYLGFLKKPAADVLSSVGKAVMQTPQVKGLQVLDRAVSSPQFQNNPIVKRVANTPILNIPGVPGAHLPKPQGSPTIGQYVGGQVYNPLKQGLKAASSPKLSVPQRALGGVQAGFAGFNATPAGLAYNLASGATAGALRSVRTGQDLNQSIAQGITNPTSIGSQGLGIKNPLLAFGLDVLAGNPKSLKGIKDIKNALYRSPHVDDANFLDEAVNILRTEKNNGKLRIKATADIDRLLTDYIRERLPAKDFAKLYEGHINRKVQVLQEFFRTADDFAIPKMGIVGQQPKYAGSINTQRLNVPQAGKQRIVKQVEAIAPELEKIKGAPLTHAEVQEAAETSGMLQKVVTREQSRTMQAGILKARERMVTLDAEITRAQASGNTAQTQRLTKELIDTIKVVNSQAADAGRKLGSFRISASEQPFRDKIVSQIMEKAQLSEQQLNELSAKVAQLDWTDARQVTELYRDFIKPTFFEKLNEYRYMNLLSSPRTHIVNAFSNTLQATMVRPLTKLVSGAIDPVASALTGKARENYVMEVPHYYRGMFAAMPTAFKKFRDVFTGKQAITNLDMDRLPSNTLLSKGNVVTKALEGSDQFFRTLIEGAEEQAFGYKFAKQGKAVSQMDISALAQQQGKYNTYRQALDPKNAAGQGHLLSWIDKGTEAIMGLRRVPGVSWFIPFIQTPMNILKQGVEYSPMGLGTLPGAANKTEQISKAIIGSTVFAGAGYLAMQDKITWAAPTDKTARDAFYAAGLQPYSVKVGNRWVGFSKLGPLAYPLALAAGIKHAYQDDPKSAARSFDESGLSALMGTMGFFADQSYMQGIGDMLSAVQGKEGFSVSRVAGNVASQYIPLSSFQRWVAQIIDPIYRKGDGVIGNIAKGIPFLSDDQPAYTNPLGEPSRRQMPELNAFSPLPMTIEDPAFKELYQQRQEQLKQNAIVNAEEKRLEAGATVSQKANQAEAAAPGKTSVQDLLNQRKAAMAEKLAKKHVEFDGGTQTVNGKLYYQENGSVKSVQLNRKIEAPTLTGNEELDKKLVSAYKGDITAKSNDIIKLHELGKISDAEAEKQLQELKAQRDAFTAKIPKAKKTTGIKKVKKVKKVRKGRKQKAITIHVPKPKKITIPKPKRVRARQYKLTKVKLKTTRLTRAR